MSEVVPEHPYASTDEIIVQLEIEEAVQEDRPISDSAARIIASWWHSGQSSGLYSFASTGAINWEAIEPEYTAALHDDHETDFDLEALRHLAAYLLDAEGVDELGNRGPVQDWHERTKWGQ